MKKQNRILKNEDFRKVISKGKRYNCSSFRIYFVPNSTELFQIGISISKKVSKSAVVRNLIKRRISAIVKNNFNLNQHYKIVIICNIGIESKTYKEIENDFCVFKSKVWKE
ncbi:MAG: ribonuclease P protein component [Mycoplasma sp.]